MTAPGPETTLAEHLAGGEPLEACYVLEAGGLRFAVPVDALLRVHRIEEITRVPRAPEHVAGVALLMNEVVACLDLGRLAGREGVPPGPCVVALVEGAELRAALVAREVGTMKVLEAAESAFLPEPFRRLGPGARGPASVEGEPAVVLDVDALLSAFAPRWTAAEAQAHGG